MTYINCRAADRRNRDIRIRDQRLDQRALTGADFAKETQVD